VVVGGPDGLKERIQKTSGRSSVFTRVGGAEQVLCDGWKVSVVTADALRAEPALERFKWR